MAKLPEVLMWWEKVPNTPAARKMMKGWVYQVAEDADYNARSPDHEKPFYFVEIPLPNQSPRPPPTPTPCSDQEKAHVRDQQRHCRRLLQKGPVRRSGRRCFPRIRWSHLSPAQSADRRRHRRREEVRHLDHVESSGCSRRDQACLC